MGQVTSELSRNDTSLPRAPRDIKFRVLIVGRANAGKTTILQRVCDTTESPEIYRRDQQGYRERVRSRPWWHVGSHYLFRLNSALAWRSGWIILIDDG
jgi:hypothetical protein